MHFAPATEFIDLSGAVSARAARMVFSDKPLFAWEPAGTDTIIDVNIIPYRPEFLDR